MTKRLISENENSIHTKTFTDRFFNTKYQIKKKQELGLQSGEAP